MRPRNGALMEGLYASWAAKDLPAVLDCMSDDVEFAMHVPIEDLPFAGETRGKAEIVPRLQTIIDSFDFLEYRPLLIRETDDTFHAQILYHYRHKTTGRELEGTMRHTGRVEAGKLVRLDEFHDTQRVVAFFELVTQEASGAPQREFPHIKRNK